MNGRKVVPLLVDDRAIYHSGCRRHRYWPLENCRASTSIFISFIYKATKSQRWMPWHQEPMKDVGDCEKPRVVVYLTLIRGCPNGETQHS